MKKWVANNQKTNDEMTNVMLSYKENICKEFEKINKERVKSMIIEMVYKHHPLLRTKAIKGVYSKKENAYSDSEFEKIIRNIYIQIHKK